MPAGWWTWWRMRSCAMGPPKHLISDQEGIFTGDVFAELLSDWDVKHRLGAVGNLRRILVIDALMLPARIAVSRGLDTHTQAQGPLSGVPSPFDIHTVAPLEGANAGWVVRHVRDLTISA